MDGWVGVTTYRKNSDFCGSLGMPTNVYTFNAECGISLAFLGIKQWAFFNLPLHWRR